MQSVTTSYQYVIKNGDTLSSIIGKMYGIQPSDRDFKKAKGFLLSINPQIKNPNKIYVGHVVRIDEYHPNPVKTKVAQTPGHTPNLGQPSTSAGQCTAYSHNVGPLPEWMVNASLGNQPLNNAAHNIQALKTNKDNHDAIWAAAWLEHNAGLISNPGGVATSSMTNLFSPGNKQLISDIGDLYAKMKIEEISRNQYNYRRMLKLKQLQQNLGPMEKLLFGNKTTQQSIRIARGGGIPATTNITKYADKIINIGKLSKVGGLVLMGVGVTASCMQIAHTDIKVEKNEIFVETLTSTISSSVTGALVGLYLVSNPVGWGTAIMLAAGSAALGYGTGKVSRTVYSAGGNPIDFVNGSGIGKLCK